MLLFVVGWSSFCHHYFSPLVNKKVVRPLYLTLCHTTYRHAGPPTRLTTPYRTPPTPPTPYRTAYRKISWSALALQSITWMESLPTLYRGLSLTKTFCINLFSLYLNPYCNENTNKILFHVQNFHKKFIFGNAFLWKIGLFFIYWKYNNV